MMCPNTLIGYVMKLVEANSAYVNMDKVSQEIGLKMLVSLCKRYEMLLGNKYTLQTCVWYSLVGIESFFDEMCADLKVIICSETVPASEKDPDLADESITEISESDNTQEGMGTVVDYVVKTSEDFDEVEGADNDKDTDVLEDFESKDEKCYSEKGQRSNEPSADGEDSESSDGLVESYVNNVETVQCSECESNKCTNDSDSPVNKSESPITNSVNTRNHFTGSCLSEQKEDANMEELNEDFEEMDSSSEIPGIADKTKYGELGGGITCDEHVRHEDFDDYVTDNAMHMNRKRKQKHPKRKVSPLKISLKKKFGHKRGIIKHISHATRTADSDGHVQHGEVDSIKSSGINTGTDSSYTRNTVDTDRQHENSENIDKSETKTVVSVECTDNVEKRLERIKLSKSAKKARLMKALEINPKKVSKVVKRSSRIQLKKRKANSSENQEISVHESAKKDGVCENTLIESNGLNGIVHAEFEESNDVIDGHVASGNIREKAERNYTSANEILDKKYGETLHVFETYEQEDKLKCYICSKVFSRRRTLYKHHRSHSEGKFACLKCGAFNKHADELQSHMDNHVRLSKYKCESCYTSFDGRQQYDTHMAGHTANTCSLCQASFPTREQLVRHGREDHGTNFALDSDRASSTERYACRVCSRKFKKRRFLTTHLILHSGELQFECSECKLFFHTRKALGRHKKTNAHCLKSGGPQVERKYLCQDCGKAYFKKHALQRHMRCHRGEKQHECQYCDFRCQEANNLKRHMSLHFESERNFVCEICGAAFHAKKTLEVHHIYKHSNERKFECSQCFLSFKDKSALKRHEKVHNLEKEHKCVCGTAFRRICNLRRHLRLVHGGDENYLPPVKHVTTLDFHKKLPLSKTDLADQFKDTYEDDSLYDDVHDTSLEMTKSVHVNNNVYGESDRLYKVSLLKPNVVESSGHMTVPDSNIPDDSTATVSDYSQHDMDRHTPTEIVHKSDEIHDTSINHDVSQQISNREMFVGNFCFPHLAMATNSFHEQQTSVLPHIHMLQNPQLKDNLQMPLPKQTPPKFTFTFGNHWQKFIPNEFDLGYRDPEHSFRFPSAHCDNSVLVSQRLVNQDLRSALHEDINMRVQHEDLGHKTIHDSQSVEQNLVSEKMVGETSYASPYQITDNYSQHNSYESVASEKTAMSEQSEEYFQSRREMAAESLAQMAALAVDASYQQQSNDIKSQLL